MSDSTTQDVIPLGYCQCGCGQKTNIATANCKRTGARKGFPVRYIFGHYNRRPLMDRFLEKIQKTDTCWLWTGSLNFSGYGMIGDGKGKSRIASRIAWELFRGEIPEGLEVLHNCPDGDNPRCVNPDHLWLGTQIENIEDCIRKGRFTSNRGENNPRAKLTFALAEAIRSEYAKGGITQITLALKYGVDPATLWSVVHYKTWTHR